jgi:hypothetical protein
MGCKKRCRELRWCKRTGNNEGWIDTINTAIFVVGSYTLAWFFRASNQKFWFDGSLTICVFYSLAFMLVWAPRIFKPGQKFPLRTQREFTCFPNDFTSTALMNVCCAGEINFYQPLIAIIDTSFNRFLFYLFWKNASLTIELFCISTVQLT